MGDIIDVRDPILGSWFEAKIDKISKKERDENQNGEKEDPSEDGFLYSIVFKG
jgi:hypothetical protein